MNALGKTLLDRMIPDLPAGIREDFFVHAATELQRKSPLLLAAMFVNSLIALFTGAQEAHWLVRYALPGMMAAFCLFSIIGLRANLDFTGKPWRARKSRGV